MSAEANVFIVFSFIFFLIEILLLIKFWFEISTFEKINRFQNEILILRSHYFSNKLNQIYGFSQKNEEYKEVFVYFFTKYNELFSKELIKITDLFLKNLRLTASSARNIDSESDQIEIYDQFNQLKGKIDQFNFQLSLISSWQNFLIEQTNFFVFLLAKIEEEIEKNKFTIDFDFSQIAKEITNQKKEIEKLRKNIDATDYEKTIVQMKDLFESLPQFVNDVLLWLKLIIFFYKNLPKIKNEFNFVCQTHKYPETKKIYNKINDDFEQQKQDIFLLILNFSFQEAEQKLFLHVAKIENLIWQIKNKDELKILFSEILKLIRKNFDFAKNKLSTSKKFVNLFEESIFYNNKKKIEFRHVNLALNKTQSLLDEMIIFEEDSYNKLFFQKPLVNLQKVLEKTSELITNHAKIENLFFAEKERNQNLFFSFLNLHAIFAKKENSYLKDIYYQEFLLATDLFVKLKKQQNIELQSTSTFISDFSRLKTIIQDLQTNIETAVLFHEITNQLIVKLNKHRFNNVFFKNKILNAEVLFSKHRYKDAIETLLEINSEKFASWTTLT